MKADTSFNPKCSACSRVGLIALKWCILAALGCSSGDLKRIEETLNQSYEGYKKSDYSAWLKLYGASNIDTCCSFYGDGYEVWWRLVVSEEDFKTIVRSAAKADNRSDSVEFETFSSLPSNWKPYTDPPTWWEIRSASGAKSIHWCYRVGDGERRRGWLFLYSDDARMAYVWHWNHQWAESECSTE